MKGGSCGSRAKAACGAAQAQLASGALCEGDVAIPVEWQSDRVLIESIKRGRVFASENRFQSHFSETRVCQFDATLVAIKPFKYCFFHRVITWTLQQKNYPVLQKSRSSH